MASSPSTTTSGTAVKSEERTRKAVVAMTGIVAAGTANSSSHDRPLVSPAMAMYGHVLNLHAWNSGGEME